MCPGLSLLGSRLVSPLEASAVIVVVVGGVSVEGVSKGAVRVGGCECEPVVVNAAGDTGVGANWAAVGVAGCACEAVVALAAVGIGGGASSFSIVSVHKDVARAIGPSFSPSFPLA